jgi:DNA-binding NtrC family response regulator
MKLSHLLYIHFSESNVTKGTKNIFTNQENLRVSEVLVCKKSDFKKDVLLNCNIILISFEEANFTAAKEILSKIISLNSKIPILIYSGEISHEKIAELLEIGASDFISNPYKPKDLVEKINRLLALEKSSSISAKKLKESLGLKSLIGQNKTFLSEIGKLPIFAKCDACVLITGETGTGKEMIARALHYLSQRTNNAFVPINCGAIPNELVENELFGHEKGAFTGASNFQKGLIQEANQGTLFLDEIDSLPLFSQVKLLRFLQDKNYRSLGSTKIHKANVRIIAASNNNLEDLIENGKLRLDLYYRLNVLQVNLPPLRQRVDDIPLLAQHFLQKYSVEFNKNISSISNSAIRKLQAHIWKGNVRELENVIERAVLLVETEIINESDIKLGISKSEKLQETFQVAKAKMIEKFEESYLQKILSTYHGNISQAAKAAGKNRRAFFELIRKYEINVENFRIQK